MIERPKRMSGYVNTIALEARGHNIGLCDSGFGKYDICMVERFRRLL